MATVVRWNPTRERITMQNALDHLVDEVWNNARTNGNGAARTATRTLALNVYESNTAYTIAAVLPGANPETLDINLHEDNLTITGEIPQPELDDNTRVHLQERHFGKFSRSLTLPNAVDVDRVEANFENGVLTLTLPKVPEAQPRTIPVRVNRAVNNN